MARDFQINGPCLALVKGRADSGIGTLQELGLAEGPIRVSLEFRHRDMQVDAWGGEIPPDVQFMLAAVNVFIPLIHFDRSILDVCIAESMGGAPAIGQLAGAGRRMGNNLPRFAGGGVDGNHYISLNLTSPVGLKPWRFYTTYLVNNPADFPLGTEKSMVQTQWRCIPYTTDPYQAGAGAQGWPLWDHTNDA